MSLLLDFFRWLRDVFTNVIKWLLTVKGLITTAVAQLIAFITGMVGRFTWTDTIGGWIDNATEYVTTLSNTEIGTVGQFVIRWFAFDQLVSAFVALIGVTGGVIVLVFSGFVASLLLLISVVLSIKAVMKLISVCSVGFLKP